MSYKIAWLVGRALPPNATYFFRRRCSAFVVGRAILPAAAFQAAFSGRERAFARQRPAESRLQPGLAAPQFGLDGLQDQKVCGIRMISCARPRGSPGNRRLLARLQKVPTGYQPAAGCQAAPQLLPNSLAGMRAPRLPVGPYRVTCIV